MAGEDLVLASTTDTESEIEAALHHGLEPDPGEAILSTVEEETPEAEKPAEKTETPKAEKKAEAKPEDKADKKADEDDGDEDEGLGKRAQKRIAKLTWQREESERKAERLERELAELKAGKREEPSKETKEESKVEAKTKPKAEDFETHEEWQEAVAAWKAEETARQTTERILKEQEDKLAAEDAEVTRQEAQARFEESKEQARERYDDFDEVMKNAAEMPLSGPTIYVIMNSPVGHDIAYYLATHPDEALALSKIQGPDSIRAIGKLEGRIEDMVAARGAESAGRSRTATAEERAGETAEAEADPKPETPLKPKKREVSKAPDPIKPVSAGANTKSTLSPEEMSYAQFKVQRNREEAAYRQSRR